MMRIIDNEEGYDSGAVSFPIHRRLLRRRHIRKLQKNKEREQRRKEEEQKLEELTRERDRKRRIEKKGVLHDKQTSTFVKSGAQCNVSPRMINISASRITSPVPFCKETSSTDTNINNNHSELYSISSPTSVLGLHRMLLSMPTKSPPPQTIDIRTSTGSTHSTTLTTGVRSSFSVPEFSPVRPTKFRKLQF